jgi:hypothetical protein
LSLILKGNTYASFLNKLKTGALRAAQKNFRQNDSMAKSFQIILPFNYFAIKLSEFFSGFGCLSEHITNR